MDNNDNIEFPSVLITQFSQMFIPVKRKALPIITTLAIYFCIHLIFHFLMLDLSLMTYQKTSVFAEYMHLLQLISK